MSYSDINTPVIEKITLPSGNTYYIADREIRNVVDSLSQTIAGGVSYIIAWDGTGEPVPANIPKGVQVFYEGDTYTGTLEANSAQAGAFYLVKSATTPSSESKDIYDEYVPIGATGSKTWEKIGDTQIALSNVVTDAHFDIHFALMQCHPDGSYSYTDNSLIKTKAKDFTGDKAVFTVTFTPKDTTTYTATTTTVTFLFPGQ